MATSQVLLMGVTGFLGSHTAIRLLKKGYSALRTLRNMKRADEIRKVIGAHTKQVDQLRFAEADLLQTDGRLPFMEGVDYVRHVASPFPRFLPKNEAELIELARKSTLNILKATKQQGVRRVVVTSSTGAIIDEKPKNARSGTFAEGDWTDAENRHDTAPYFRSKTLDGSTPAIPKIGFDMVDVRSVADLLILAMEHPKAAGERFVGSEGYWQFAEVAKLLRKHYQNRKIPKMILPDFAVRLFAQIDPALKPILLDLSVERRVDHSKEADLLRQTRSRCKRVYWLAQKVC